MNCHDQKSHTGGLDLTALSKDRLALSVSGFGRPSEWRLRVGFDLFICVNAASACGFY
jgi:hypothetical protein